ncbi:hypothetical protein SAMN05444377_1063 [Flavobacterium fontis]|uniref:Phage abortive infection protein n=1 Tax=Flavobacterium fontis TaxID=1124188 RepID=A0A1M5ABJ3_9FLAO|nr:hypothetical protein [Flavobacterium fontis]SHF27619.1 hypothetical protein SAMN05444377_1063 [Flavobacterium fontis]
MDSKKVINETRLASFFLIILVAFGVILILSQLLFYDNKPQNFGVIGDAIGGILGPIIGIVGALLTFLAFYIQKIANDEIKNQFKEQKVSQHKDFLFANYKTRIMLLINEINSFNISFHGGSLISDISLLTDKSSKKYNFIGIQAINLYLIEYFKKKEENNSSGKKEFRVEDSYHAIIQNIFSIITSYHNLHIDIENSDLDNVSKAELNTLLKYTYFSKFNYFLEYLNKKNTSQVINEQIKYLLNLYRNDQMEIVDSNHTSLPLPPE